MTLIEHKQTLRTVTTQIREVSTTFLFPNDIRQIMQHLDNFADLEHLEK